MAPSRGHRRGRPPCCAWPNASCSRPDEAVMMPRCPHMLIRAASSCVSSPVTSASRSRRSASSRWPDQSNPVPRFPRATARYSAAAGRTTPGPDTSSRASRDVPIEGRRCRRGCGPAPPIRSRWPMRAPTEDSSASCSTRAATRSRWDSHLRDPVLVEQQSCCAQLHLGAAPRTAGQEPLPARGRWPSGRRTPAVVHPDPRTAVRTGTSPRPAPRAGAPPRGAPPRRTTALRVGGAPAPGRDQRRPAGGGASRAAAGGSGTS